MEMDKWAKAITLWRKKNGFITPSTIGGVDGERMLGKLMLIVTEISEAAEAVRKNDIDNFKEELADTFIRLLDICGAMNIDPEVIINDKMTINHGRPFRHGTKITL